MPINEFSYPFTGQFDVTQSDGLNGLDYSIELKNTHATHKWPSGFPVTILPDVFANVSKNNDAFWSQVQSDGGNIRIYKNTTFTDANRLPVDVAHIDVPNKALHLATRIDADVAVGGSIYMGLKGSGGFTQPAADAAYGSEAVWSDYGYVRHFGDAVAHNGTVIDHAGNQGDGTYTAGDASSAMPVAGSSDRHKGLPANGWGPNDGNGEDKIDINRSNGDFDGFSLSCLVKPNGSMALEGALWVAGGNENVRLQNTSQGVRHIVLTSGTNRDRKTTTSIPKDVWVHVWLESVRSPSLADLIRYDGVDQGMTGNGGSGSLSSYSGTTAILNFIATGAPFDGFIAEFRQQDRNAGAVYEWWGKIEADMYMDPTARIEAEASVAV